VDRFGVEQPVGLSEQRLSPLYQGYRFGRKMISFGKGIQHA
jgi:hypothetical protein